MCIVTIFRFVWMLTDSSQRQWCHKISNQCALCVMKLHLLSTIIIQCVAFEWHLIYQFTNGVFQCRTHRVRSLTTKAFLVRQIIRKLFVANTQFMIQIKTTSASVWKRERERETDLFLDDDSSTGHAEKNVYTMYTDVDAAGAPHLNFHSYLVGLDFENLKIW